MSHEENEEKDWSQELIRVQMVKGKAGAEVKIDAGSQCITTPGYEGLSACAS